MNVIFLLIYFFLNKIHDLSVLRKVLYLLLKKRPGFAREKINNKQNKVEK